MIKLAKKCRNMVGRTVQKSGFRECLYRVAKNASMIKYVTMLKKMYFIRLLFKIIGLSLCVNFAPRITVVYHTVSADIVICV